MTFIRINAAQADALRGTYNERYALDPVPLPGTDEYILTDAVLAHPAFAGALATLQALPTYPAWQTGVAYGSGAIVEHEGRLWAIVQAHTSQADWEPQNVPALWRTAHEAMAGPQPWVQPAGAHDAYALGAQVTHNGSVWESTFAANVWEPGVFGWIVVE